MIQIILKLYVIIIMYWNIENILNIIVMVKFILNVIILMIEIIHNIDNQKEYICVKKKENLLCNLNDDSVSKSWLLKYKKL